MAKIYNIAVIKGDGIGPEIVDEAIKALDAASAEFGFELSYNFYLMGGAAIDVFGELERVFGASLLVWRAYFCQASRLLSL